MAQVWQENDNGHLKDKTISVWVSPLGKTGNLRLCELKAMIRLSSPLPHRPFSLVMISRQYTLV